MRQLKHQVNELEDRTVISFDRLEAKLDNMKARLLDSQTNLTSVAQKSITVPQYTESLSAQMHIPYEPNDSSSCINPATSPVSSSRHEESFLATVYLASEKFTFDKREVKSLSIYQYSKDIPLLFVEWENSQRLIINNRGIALKFWPKFYQKKNHIGNGHIWNSIKMMWGNWKVSNNYRHSLSYDSPSYNGD